MKTSNKYQTTTDRQEFTSVKLTIDNSIEFKMIRNPWDPNGKRPHIRYGIALWKCTTL